MKLEDRNYVSEGRGTGRLAQAQHELTMEGYGRFPKGFFDAGLWKATAAEPSHQQLGLLKHETEDGGRINIFNLRTSKTFIFGEGDGMAWDALQLARKEPMMPPEPTLNPFYDQMPFGDNSYPLPRYIGYHRFIFVLGLCEYNPRLSQT